MKFLVVLSALGLVLSSCTQVKKAPSLKTEDDKIVYTIGHDMGTNFQTLQLSSSEVNTLLAAISDGINNKKSAVDKKSVQKGIQQFVMGRKNKLKDVESKAAATYLEGIAKTEGIVKMPNGIMYKITKEGTGVMPKATDRVKVHYHGTLRDGTVFDSSKDRGSPATFPLNQVIPCWTQGMQKLKVGSKADLYCPSAVAYGDNGRGGKIKPGAALKFEVELLEIVDAGAAPQIPGMPKMPNLPKMPKMPKPGGK